MTNLSLSPLTSSLYTHKIRQDEQSAGRAEKAQSFLAEVLPSAIQLGTNALDSQTSRNSRTGSGPILATASPSANTLGASALSKATSLIGGLWGATNLIQNWGHSTPIAGATNGMAVGATIGSFVAPGIGTAIGAAAGILVGGLIGCITSGKHRDQQVRDAVREKLQGAGILDNTYSIGLADGSRYNVGLDGGPKAELGGRRPFEVDFSNPLARYAVAWINPLVHLGIGGSEKIKTDFVGYFANAAMSNAQTLTDVRNNVLAIFDQFGVSDEMLGRSIISAAQQGVLDEQTAVAYLGGIDERRSIDELPAELEIQ